MPFLVKADQRFVNLAVLFRQRNLMPGNIVGYLQMADGAFELLEMVGDILGGDEFVPEKRAQQFAA